MNNRRKGKRIMVVDDESDLILFYRMSLEYYGFEVETFNDPRKALSSFKPDYHDLIILDIKMPHIDGFELYQELKKILMLMLAFLPQVSFTTRNFEQKNTVH
jgi:DNA-binding response OmpR family regulator